MNTIGQTSLAATFALAVALGVSASASASAQQQVPGARTQQNAPTQQTTPAPPAPGMGHEMMRKGMEHDKMGGKGMEGDHGRMGPGMKNSGSAPTNDSTATTGTNPSTNSNTTPSTGSK